MFCEVGELASGSISPITQEKIRSMGKKFAVFKSLGTLYAYLHIVVVVVAYTVFVGHEGYMCVCNTVIWK